MTSPGHDERERDDERHDEGSDWLDAVSRKLGHHDTTPEERLEQLLAERRRELEQHAGSFESAVADLGRREELVRDARTSVERALRVGTADLDAREGDLADVAHELTKREARIRAEEAALADRRSELGAVELKRAAVEQREQALAARETDLAAREEALEVREQAPAPTPGEAPSPVLAFVPGASYRLVDIDRPGIGPGDPLEVEEEEYLVGRVGPSPLPGDSRRCAYLVLGPRRSGADGST
jgi:chromosome segregation ATPase